MKVNLQSAISTLQDILTEPAKEGSPHTPQSIQQKAAAKDFPYPELAAQVFQFLQTQKTGGSKELNAENISDAFMTLLMSGKSLQALGGKQTQNPWLNVRAVLRNTGMGVGSSLLEVYHAVRQTGLGYTPTLLDVSSELSALWTQFKGPQNLETLRAFMAAQGLDPWKARLLAMWFKRKKGLGIPNDEDLEELLADHDNIEALQDVDGPWEIYERQAQALRTLRSFGRALVSLADATDEA